MTRPTFEERLSDPLSHFPYKHDDALRAVGNDSAARAEVDTTAAYVAAQAAWFGNPSAESRAAERDAAAALQEARGKRRAVRDAAAVLAQLEAVLNAAEHDEAVSDEEFEQMSQILGPRIEQARQAHEEAAGHLEVYLASRDDPSAAADTQEG